MNECAQKCKEREVIPDAIEALREARITASAIDTQVWRLEKAGGKDRAKQGCESAEKNVPPMYAILATSIKELNLTLHQIHASLTHEVNVLIGESN